MAFQGKMSVASQLLQISNLSFFIAVSNRPLPLEQERKSPTVYSIEILILHSIPCKVADRVKVDRSFQSTLDNAYKTA